MTPKKIIIIRNKKWQKRKSLQKILDHLENCMENIDL